MRIDTKYITEKNKQYVFAVYMLKRILIGCMHAQCYDYRNPESEI